MGLLITNAKFKNTEISAPELYARLQYFCLLDGKKVNVKLVISTNKAEALAWKEIPTNLPEALTIVLGDNENQDLATIHNAVRGELEALGFEVTIDLA